MQLSVYVKDVIEYLFQNTVYINIYSVLQKHIHNYLPHANILFFLLKLLL